MTDEVNQISTEATVTATDEDESDSKVEASQNGVGPPCRVKLTEEQLQNSSKDDILSHWKDLDLYIESIESQNNLLEKEATNLRETVERVKQQLAESQHREKVLVRRLATKEQEMQDYASQLAELRAAQVPSALALRSALLDPAASLLVQKLRHELAATKTRLEETQNELSAWKFTPDSNTGKRLMAKCRLLYQENEELGRVIASGRLAKLEGELALQKSFSAEVKKSQSEMDEFLQELDEDVEGMQGTIYFLQQQLKAAKEKVSSLTQENSALRLSGGSLQLEEKESRDAWEGGEGADDEEIVEDSTAEIADESQPSISQEFQTQTPMGASLDLSKAQNSVADEDVSCEAETSQDDEVPCKRVRTDSTENQSSEQE